MGENTICDPPDLGGVGDGKIRLSTILDHISDPSSLADVNGGLNAELKLEVEIDLGLFSITKEWLIAPPIKIISFDSHASCNDAEPPLPNLATIENGVLLVNIGPRSPLRNTADKTDGDDRVDIVYHYDREGTLSFEEFDLDFDGRFDLWTYYQGGKRVREEKKKIWTL